MCSLVLAGCGGRKVTLPSDAGTPLPDAAAVHAAVSAACTNVRTFVAELALSGRAADQRLRGRVHAGFASPDSMRLEGVAPFGPPAFILAARDARATLLLPRDQRVVQGARPEAVLSALTGVELAPADLQAVLTGCVVPRPRPSMGRLHAGGWASIDLEGGATLFLRRVADRWQVRAARRGSWQIEYDAWQGQFPATVHLRGDSPVLVDLTAQVSQIEANVDLEPAAFALAVPRDAESMTLQELRDAGPLRGQ